MKISTFIGLLVIVGAIIFIATTMIEEAETKYGMNVNKSEWEGKYDYANEINASIAPLKNSLATIQDEDAGWFSRITEGLSAIPRAVVLVPSLVFGGFVFGGELITGLLSSLHIPAVLISVVLVVLIVWGVFKLVEFFQRWQL